MKILATLLLAVLVLVGVFIGITHVSNEADHDMRFTGACQYAGGQVHDDLCVDGDTVLFKKSRIK